MYPDPKGINVNKGDDGLLTPADTLHAMFH